MEGELLLPRPFLLQHSMWAPSGASCAVPRSYMMQSLSLCWCLGRQLASIHKQPRCQHKLHLPPDCQISTSPCAEEEAARAVLSRKHSQFCKLLVITLGFLLCKDRRRGALEVLQLMETHTHKRQLCSKFLRNAQAPKCGHQRGGPGKVPLAEGICKRRRPCKPKKQEANSLPPLPCLRPLLSLSPSLTPPPSSCLTLSLLYIATETTFLTSSCKRQWSGLSVFPKQNLFF